MKSTLTAATAALMFRLAWLGSPGIKCCLSGGAFTRYPLPNGWLVCWLVPSYRVHHSLLFPFVRWEE
uniref:Putative secreted protein n=1 Tax=Anopheles marajoara TaxID=58244 RepID=A0A2M4CFS1_9DIPT